MRTNIVIDDKLMAAAMEAGGFNTKKEAVEEGLRLLARRKAYRRLLALGGQLQWAGADSAEWTAASENAVVLREPPGRYTSGTAEKPRPARRLK